MTDDMDMSELGLPTGEAEACLTADPEVAKGLLKGITVCRLTMPTDANVYGNVHGGTILKLIEDAGTIIATRYCNRTAHHSEPCVAAMVRIEHMDFLLPMKIGEVAELTAEIIYTSQHSLLVEIKVHGENIITGVKRLTNCARLWYVPVAKSLKVLAVPMMPYDSAEQEEFGRKLYESQKACRRKNIENSNVNKSTPNAVCLSVLIGANDVTMTQHCRAGVLLKLMDECAGIVSAKHCQTNVVTACLNATNFYKTIPMGSLVTICGVPTFTSARSVEVEVIVELENIFTINGGKESLVESRGKAVDAYFTFVAIDNNGRALPVPQLQVISEEEKKRYEAGKERYERRRQKQQSTK